MASKRALFGLEAGTAEMPSNKLFYKLERWNYITHHRRICCALCHKHDTQSTEKHGSDTNTDSFILKGFSLCEVGPNNS